ncbi:hypothetical protein AVEN_140733-1 [Araneus ventricosus]|uniref:Uncharacterized protein n=1 Tax=Araneus ventricosus TaxID=182803 RepID=A0A4Y2EM24_ARAVE|nr:hypothetical protein AVEN_235835-1 [Araneus ventricosus]GBM30056.1 hypothetical protein AVEN_58351-1 [Araneus ventricosus]GBM30185.1 hypothetical protein AVEN_186618-1 [Araneus ventricosus]GBM30240.1 hypothetical protein AVEN_140733-1 [Araneus ventricosus]
MSRSGPRDHCPGSRCEPSPRQAPQRPPPRKIIFYGNYKIRFRPTALQGLEGRLTISVNLDFLFIFNSPVHCLIQNRKFGLENSVLVFQFLTYNFMLSFSIEDTHRNP